MAIWLRKWSKESQAIWLNRTQKNNIQKSTTNLIISSLRKNKVLDENCTKCITLAKYFIKFTKWFRVKDDKTTYC